MQLGSFDQRQVQTRTDIEKILREYYRTRRNWKRFTCQLPGGGSLVVGELCAAVHSTARRAK